MIYSKIIGCLLGASFLGLSGVGYGQPGPMEDETWVCIAKNQACSAKDCACQLDSVKPCDDYTTKLLKTYFDPDKLCNTLDPNTESRQGCNFYTYTGSVDLSNAHTDEGYDSDGNVVWTIYSGDPRSGQTLTLKKKNIKHHSHFHLHDSGGACLKGFQD